MDKINNTLLTEELINTYEMVIGLEVHCQLLTESKIFASDTNKFGSDPNQNISVITLAHPGVLPKLNKKAVELAVRMGLACGCKINNYTYFDRKNYFYPDLPKGYQLSQDKYPICVGGEMEVKLKSGKKILEMNRIHLEEDAGKSVHTDFDATFLDYNRAGTPLVEIVSEPCMHSAEEAGAYVSEIRRLVRYLDISDGNMEEGSLRCDVNVSIRKKGDTKLGTKVEVKNVNSIRFVQKAIDFEFKRQIETIETGGKIIQETRTFDANTGETYSMRVKETMNDYRYFPDPDLSPLHLSETWIAEVKANMPALPKAMFQKFVNHYALPEYDATVLTDTKEMAQYFEDVCQHSTHYKSVSNWLMTSVKSYLNENNIEIQDFTLSAKRLADLIALVENNEVSNSAAAQKLFPLMFQNTEKSALALAQENNLIQNSNTDNLQTLIDEVLTENAEKVQEYRKGKKGLMGMFVGEVMKKSKGTADPKLTNQLLGKALN